MKEEEQEQRPAAADSQMPSPTQGDSMGEFALEFRRSLDFMQLQMQHQQRQQQEEMANMGRMMAQLMSRFAGAATQAPPYPNGGSQIAAFGGPAEMGDPGGDATPTAGPYSVEELAARVASSQGLQAPMALAVHAQAPTGLN